MNGMDLKQRRLNLKMTLQDVANIVGVGRSTVRKWETGMIENMRRDKIPLLAKALKTTPAAIMGWPESQYWMWQYRLAEQIKNSDLTPQQLAEEVGIHENKLFKIIYDDEYDFDTSILEDIAYALGCTLNDIGVCKDDGFDPEIPMDPKVFNGLTNREQLILQEYSRLSNSDDPKDQRDKILIDSLLGLDKLDL